MTKNRTPTQVYLDPGMHPGLEVKGLSNFYPLQIAGCAARNNFAYNVPQPRITNYMEILTNTPADLSDSLVLNVSLHDTNGDLAALITCCSISERMSTESSPFITSLMIATCPRK